MRTPARRDPLAGRRDSRLFDAAIFARLCRARDYLGDCYRDRASTEQLMGNVYRLVHARFAGGAPAPHGH